MSLFNINKDFLYLIKRFRISINNEGLYRTVKKVIKYFCGNKIDLDRFYVDQNISLDEIFIRFGTDKGSLDGKKTYDFLYKSTTKFKNYYEWICRENIKNYPYQLGSNLGGVYENIFKKKRFEKVKILEIGVANGHSVASWHSYFPNAEIFGIDNKKHSKFFYKSQRIYYFNINIFDYKNISKFINNYGKFDFIIDDSLHTQEAMLTNIKNFFFALNSGGYYFLEDFKAIDYFKKKVMKYNLDNKANYFVKDGITIEEIFFAIKNKNFFDNSILDKNILQYIFDTVEDVNIIYTDEPWASLGIIKKKI